MSESIPQNPERDISSYENKVKKEYSELGKEGIGIENWGTMIAPSGERFNGYTDKRFINYSFTEPILKAIEGKENSISIADLGGDDGFLLNEVMIELKMKDPDINTKGLVVDIDSTGKAGQKFNEKQNAGERQKIEYIVADITRLPFDDGMLDVVMSRMTMQYLDQEQQGQFLREISRVLKKEGLCLIQTMTAETDNENFNQIWTKITELISRSSDFKRCFPWFGEFTKQTQFTEEYALMPIFGSRQVHFPFSVPAFSERFHIDQDELNTLFETESKRTPDLFEIINGQLCLKARLLNLRFQKV